MSSTLVFVCRQKGFYDNEYNPKQCMNDLWQVKQSFGSEERVFHFQVFSTAHARDSITISSDFNLTTCFDCSLLSFSDFNFSFSFRRLVPGLCRNFKTASLSLLGSFMSSKYLYFGFTSSSSVSALVHP